MKALPLKVDITIRLKGWVPIRLREAEPSDATEILAYLKQVAGESDFLTFGSDELPMNLYQEKQMLETSRAAENHLILLAETGGKPVGLLSMISKKRPRIRHLTDLGVSVLKTHQNLGLGRALVETAIQWAEKSRVVRKINLKVRVDNEKAIALYSRLGFAMEGRVAREFCIDGKFFDCFAMGRLIDPPLHAKGETP